jgi:hypothetical protein
VTEQPAAESSSARRRRRRRATSGQGAPAPEAAPAAPLAQVEEPRQRPAKKARVQRDPAERGLRDLVGAGKSQLGVSGALRGRDVNRPTEQDLAEAEQNVVIVRRHWQPPADGPKP